MRFKHKNVHLVPYPYICTMHVELNSFQQGLSLGKSVQSCWGREVSSSTCEPNGRVVVERYQCKVCNVLKVKRKSEIPGSTEMEETVKRRRVEGRAETSYPKLRTDRPGAESIHRMIKVERGFKKNYSKEIQCEHSPASRTVRCNQETLWKSVEYDVEQRAEGSQHEGEMQQMEPVTAEGTVEPKRGGLSELWRRYSWEQCPLRAASHCSICFPLGPRVLLLPEF
ncbi:UNVERIFIED_CONTAM: hypothetical protein H355_014122 [Colinus virginianus]|nr:hypothetical protein H355_014122 [Colinus virginianus]